MSTEAAPGMFTRAAQKAAAVVIREYSTSFSASVALLHEPVRTYVSSVYAMVRVADEIVDGAATGHGLTPQHARAALDDYERRTHEAMASGFSTDLVLHAFAHAARAGGIDTDLTAPFFASMRADLDTSEHSEGSFDTYVYGSAEVVGLMCLRLFTTDASATPVTPSEEVVAGARRLGAAFQKVNFLRDLQADAEDRGRSYFPDIDPTQLTDAQRDALLDDIDADLAAAEATIALLPPSSRTAVQVSHDLFAELSRRLRRTPARELMHRRVRVPDPVKAQLVAKALAKHEGAGLVRRAMRSFGAGDVPPQAGRTDARPQAERTDARPQAGRTDARPQAGRRFPAVRRKDLS